MIVSDILKKIDLQGNGFIEDCFCLSVSEASKLLGNQVSYEDILVHTTNAFAPGFDTGNTCKELWVANSWVNHHGIPENAFEILGIKVEKIVNPEEILRFSTSSQEYRLPLLKQVKDSMSEGKVIVVCGGWERSVEPWWAGIILTVQEDGKVLGAHPNGRKDCVLENIISGELFAISLSTGNSSFGNECKTIENILRNAILRIRGKGEIGAFSKDKFCEFGVDAMDTWISQIAEVPHFCPDCYKNKGSGWKSAEVVSQVVMRRSRVAAKWLKKIAENEYFEKSKSLLLDACAHYEKIDLLLRSSEGYKLIIFGDLEKQKQHVQEVLIPVKREFLEAAEMIEKALNGLRIL